MLVLPTRSISEKITYENVIPEPNCELNEEEHKSFNSFLRYFRRESRLRMGLEPDEE